MTAALGSAQDQWRDVRTFFLSMAWGVLAGVVCGAAAGATYGALFGLLGLGTPSGVMDPIWGLIVIAFVYGLTSGFLLSLLPAAVAAAAITTVLAVRHPDRAAEDAVKRDLTAVFAVVVGVLNVAGLVAVGMGGHLSHFGEYLPILVPANVAMVPVAWKGRGYVARSWCAARALNHNLLHQVGGSFAEGRQSDILTFHDE